MQLIILLVFVAIILGPFATIWALNLLFGLHIPYTFLTWLAVLVLSAAFGNTKMHVKSQ
jgi:hypothetical protein